GKDKSLTGYGGGFDVKKYLLAHELGTDIENLPFSDCSRRIVG
ncbi:MAG TPA: cysteine methyltransferase, partial [Parasutterella excrementihominis]|nr:cysteine methyltransferase [Parasutterella excrementihominis]